MNKKRESINYSPEYVSSIPKNIFTYFLIFLIIAHISAYLDHYANEIWLYLMLQNDEATPTALLEDLIPHGNHLVYEYKWLYDMK